MLTLPAKLAVKLKGEKLYVNGRFLFQKITGVQRFAIEFIKELKQAYDFEILVPEEYDGSLRAAYDFNTVKGGSSHFWEQITLATFVNRNKGTLINLCNTAPLLCRKNIVTIHDLAFENKDWVRGLFRKYYSFLIPRIAKRSAAVITVSECIKEELVDRYQLNREKVIVIYNKVSKAFLDAETAPLNFIEQPFFLAVGSINKRKNYQWLCEVFSAHEVPSLIIVGSKGGAFSEFEISTKNCLVVSDVSDAQLKWLYQKCEAYINFSLYEGFGIPNIEAMSQGAKIICSDIPVNHEVCGESATYVALGDDVELVKQLNSVSSLRADGKRWEKFQRFDIIEKLKSVL